MEAIVLKAVELLNNVYENMITATLRDTELKRVNGILGTSLIMQFHDPRKSNDISSNINFFLDYQLAEDMVFYFQAQSNINLAQDIIHRLFEKEIKHLILQYDRKQKLDKLNEYKKTTQ